MLIKGPMPMTKENRKLCRTGAKTQMRRPIKWPLKGGSPNPIVRIDKGISAGSYIVFDGNGYNTIFSRYQVGETVYIPEPYQIVRGFEGNEIGPTGFIGVYLDDFSRFDKAITQAEWGKWMKRKYPSRDTQARFMYKSLARDFYKIKRVWVEQVQDISLEDCYAEGIQSQFSADNENPNNEPITPLKMRFKNLWDSINKKRGYGYDTNCWNFAYEFERIEK